MIHRLCKDARYCFMYKRYINGMTQCDNRCDASIKSGLIKIMHDTAETTTDFYLMQKIREHFNKYES